MEDLSQKILKRLEKENIQPIPKWRFLIKRTLIWSLFVVSIVLGSLACGILIYQMQHVEWGILVFKTESPLKIILSIIPYIWIILIIALIFSALYHFRHTTKGYRYRPFIILSLSLLFSVGGGALGYIFGLSSSIDHLFQRHIPFYQGWEERRIAVWMNPDNGLLAGEILRVESDLRIVLNDFHGKTWRVDIKDTLWRGWTRPEKGMKIKLIGHKIEDSKFSASEIRPWYGRGRHRGRGPGRGTCDLKNRNNRPLKNP